VKDTEAAPKKDRAAQLKEMNMKRFMTAMTALLAVTLLGSTAASAQPFRPGPYGARGFERHDFVRYSPRHHWVRGDRFFAPSYRYVVVDDWYRMHLRRPPFGARWIRYGDEFLLVAPTGFILDVRTPFYW